MADENPNGDERIYDPEKYPYRPPALDQRKKKEVPDEYVLRRNEENVGQPYEASSAQAGAEVKHEGQIGPGFKVDGAPQFLDRIKNMSRRKKVGIMVGLSGGILSILIAVLSFLPFELIQIRHIVTDKIGGTEAHVYMLGRQKMYSTQFFFDQNGNYSGSKVGGVRRLMRENRSTNTMIKALQANGYQIEFEKVGNKQTGKIKSLTKVDENGNILAQYTSEKALKSAWGIKDSGDLNGILREVFPDKSDFWYNRATNQLYRRWNLTRTDRFKETVAEVTGLTKLNRRLLTTEDKVKLALRRTLFGTNSSGPPPTVYPPTNNDEATLNDKKASQDAKDAALANITESSAVQQAINDGNSDRIQMLNDPTFDGVDGATLKTLFSSKDLNSAVKSLKGGLSAGNLLSSLSLLNTAEKGCTINSTLNAIQDSARILRAAQLMQFTMTVLTVADAVQNGKGPTTAEVSTMMSYLNSKDSNGKGFFAASGVNYWNNPTSGNTGFAGYDKSQRDQYSVGGGFTGVLGEIRTIANKLQAGASCKALHNPFVRAFGFVAGGVAAFFTAGTSVTLQVAGGIFSGVAASFALNTSIHVLSPIVAGTVVNGSEAGTAIGNAFVSGAEVLASANGASTGMRPLTNKEFKVAEADVQHDQQVELAQTPLADRLFSPNVDSSLTSTAAMGLYNFKVSNLITAPFASLSKMFNFGGLFGAPAVADPVSSCPDPDIKNNNLAATPFCNLIMGIPDSAMNNPAYAPDKIDDTINATNAKTQNLSGLEDDTQLNVDDYGNPIKNSPYYNYLQECTADGGPSIDIIHTGTAPGDNKDDQSYTPRCTNDLFNIYRLYMTIGQGENDALTGNLSPDNTTASTTNPTPPTPPGTPPPPPSPTSGNAQQLAQQIQAAASKGRIKFNVLNSLDQLDGSTPELNIQETASGQPANTTTTCGGRGGIPPNKTVALDPSLLQFILDLSQVQVVQINALAGQCHSSSSSNHYQGKAVDFGCPFDPTQANEIGSKYNISDQTGETCANAAHYHYSIGGH